jgi:hypothetical protein
MSSDWQRGIKLGYATAKNLRRGSIWEGLYAPDDVRGRGTTNDMYSGDGWDLGKKEQKYAAKQRKAKRMSGPGAKTT